VLSYVEYDPKDLATRFRNLAESAVVSNRITPAERKVIMGAFEAGLRGYTYFES
jgi:arginine decarboxylase